MATSLIAVAIGLVIGLLTDPGSGTGLTADDAPKPGGGRLLAGLPHRHRPDRRHHAVHRTATCFRSSSWPSSPASPPSSSARRPSRSSTFGEAVLELLQKALWWVIRLAPIGTLGLIGTAIADYGWDLIGKYATFTADVYIGCALVLFGVYPLLLATVAKVNPLQFFRGAWPAIQLAFVSRSSVGTMPVTQKVTERLGVPREYASFAVPFGATTKMDGCAAIYPALAAIFIAQFFGVQPGHRGLPADRLRLGHRLGRHRRPDRRDRDADADPLHAGPAAGGRRPAAGDRPDPGHDAHRHQRGRPGPRPGPRLGPRGDPGPGRLRLRLGLPAGRARPPPPTPVAVAA